jgi:uncharacterized BrkB/YihY/UPF0761 family membrane protein
VAVVLIWLYVIAYVIIVSGSIAAAVARRAAHRESPSPEVVDHDD